MQRTLNFPIKGTFYYSADLAMELDMLQQNALLHLVFEPENIYDEFAIQIWLDHSPTEDLKSCDYLIGYVPKILSKPFNNLLVNYQVKSLNVSHLAKHGQFIEVDCRLVIEQPFMKFVYLFSLATLSQQTQFLKRLKRRWYSSN